MKWATKFANRLAKWHGAAGRSSDGTISVICNCDDEHGLPDV